MTRIKMMLPGIVCLIWTISATAQNTDIKSDTTAKVPVSRPGKPKPYKEVITSKAITDSGLFIVHRIEDRYYFEIPDSLLERDILTVNRISKAAADVRPQRGFYGYAGDLIGENVVRLCKGPNNKIFIKRISYAERSDDSSENGLYRSVLNSNLQPIVASFDIKAYKPDSTGIVLDLTDYISGDNDVLFFDGQVKKAFGLSAIQADKSYIEKISSFPENIEVCTIKTFGAGEGSPKTYELNSSVVLLPKIPMKPRYYDPRVGYFATDYKNFDANPQGIENTAMITRWRLEPKEEDIDKYKRGELVEPKKPIVFYIDPATPKKWVPYLIQGVNDWQKAFEKAGFKHAIYALEAPVNDPAWSLEDARHNAIIYKPSTIPNAYGPHVHDPRSGEILETHVQWFHNVMELLHDWYMVQAGAIDPKARTMEFDDSLMGQLIRFVSSHEIGHTLGLQHNFGASSTVPVDSLRNKKWVEENGFCPSIMDYARFNYVAQPEDSISEKGIFPRIGVYDEWAIEWGYKWLPGFKTEKEEKEYMNHWIIDKLEKNKVLRYGNQQYIDPRNQSEDVGDNAMKASYYGIQNLKYILSKLIEWTKIPNTDYQPLKRLYAQVLAQYQRYLFHVTNNIGGVLMTDKTVEQKGPIVEFRSREYQKAAIQFLQEELFKTPEWILNKDILTLTGRIGVYQIVSFQKAVMETIISHKMFTSLLWFETNQPGNAYTFIQLLQDLEKGIWSELETFKAIDLYRRNLQKIYALQLIRLLTPQDRKTADDILFGIDNMNTDDISIVRGYIKNLLLKINKALPDCKDKISKMHLVDVKMRLTKAVTLDEEKVPDQPGFNAINFLPIEERIAIQDNMVFFPY